MENRKLKRMFGQVKLPPEREDAMLAELLRQGEEGPAVKRTGRRRAAAAAAVLAVVLAGTALASTTEAAAALMDFLTLQVFSDGEDQGYAVTGGTMTKYPLSAFSPALLEASEGRGGLAVVTVRFDTWEEVRDFVGVDFVWPDGVGDWGRYIVYLFHTGGDQLWGVEVGGVWQDGPVLGEVTVKIRTEYWQDETAEAGVTGSGGEGEYTRLDSYAMSNGAVAEVVQYTGTGEHPHGYCEGYFMRNGMMYCVASYGTRTALEDAVTRLHAILDAYE